LHEIGETSDLLGACRLAAGQRAKAIQIGCFLALRSQVRVEEREVGELILRVVVDVLVHVRIQLFQGSGVGCTPLSPRNFAVLDTAEFVVLLPRVRLEDFECSQEPQNRRVSLCETGTLIVGEGRYRLSQQPGADGSGSHREQEGTAAGGTRRLREGLSHLISSFWESRKPQGTTGRSPTLPRHASSEYCISRVFRGKFELGLNSLLG